MHNVKANIINLKVNKKNSKYNIYTYGFSMSRNKGGYAQNRRR